MAGVRYQIALSGSTQVLAVDEACLSLTGYAAADFCAGELQFFSLFHRDDADVVARLQTLDVEGVDGIFNARLRHAQGHIVLVRGHYRLLKDALLELDLQDSRELYIAAEACGPGSQLAALLDNGADFVFF